MAFRGCILHIHLVPSSVHLSLPPSLPSSLPSALPPPPPFPPFLNTLCSGNVLRTYACQRVRILGATCIDGSKKRGGLKRSGASCRNGSSSGGSRARGGPPQWAIRQLGPTSVPLFREGGGGGGGLGLGGLGPAGRGGGTPTYMAQNDRLVALIISSHVCWGKKNCPKKNFPLTWGSQSAEAGAGGWGGGGSKFFHDSHA